MTATTSRRVFGDYVVPAATVAGRARRLGSRHPCLARPPLHHAAAVRHPGRRLGVALPLPRRTSWVTLYETLGGFALSILVGVPLAVLIVYSPALKSALYPLIVLTQSVPKIAIAPVLLLVVGHGEIPKIIVAFLVAFFPVVVDTATGLAATPPELLDLSRSYRASAFKTFLKVRLPMALPFFFAGAKVAITLSVIGAVVGEFVGSDQGLGYVILSATSYWKTELAFSSMILLSVMAIVLFGAVALVERIACPWLAPGTEE